ncbi:MAG TPA: pentapeptide repeat-containing protein [Acidobacteriaceae bacterium]|nr:pentapeptide repeat-containing protein [Acidobacteriaceae bacterium]
MLDHHRPRRPTPWAELKGRHPALRPFLAVDWLWQWLAWLLGNWSFLQVLEYLGSFSVLIAVIFWFSDGRHRVQQRHYEAWQVINTAEGKGGSGGRMDALEELNADHVALTGVDVSSAFLQGVRLPGARLARSSFSAADLRSSDLHGADLTWASLHFTNLRNSNLQSVEFEHTDLSDADLSGSNLQGARLDAANLTDADLRQADLGGIAWQQIAAVHGANIAGIRNAPAGFAAWALRNGAIQNPSAP